jgi:hypothetical protein
LIQPGLFFGKGFGDLPDWLSWLRPFAVTGAIVDALPIETTSKALAPNPSYSAGLEFELTGVAQSVELA